MAANVVGLVPGSTLPDEAPPPSSEEKTTSLATTVVAVLAAVAALRFARDLIIPVVLGVLISYALDPIVTALTRLRIPRAISAALVLGLFAGGIGFGVYTLQDDALALARSLPQKAQDIRQILARRRTPGSGTIESVQKLATDLENSANAAAAPASPPPGVTAVQIQEKPLDLRSYLWAGSVGLIAFVSESVLLLFLVYFLLASGNLYRRKLVKLMGPSLAKKKVTLQVIDDIDRQVQRFLLVRLLASTLVAVASAVAYMVVGIQYAIVWGVAAGLFNSIPYFGPGLVTAAVTVAAFVQFGSVGPAVAVALISLALTSIDGFLLVPWLISRASRMNEVAVFVGLLFWGWLWGVVGLFVAVPIMMAFKAVCDRVESLQPIGELLGE
jgi:predicted PurR-regulated permease PerM